jgi:hypothetical protein
MNRQERIKKGLIGKKTFYTKSGEKIVLDLDDMENLTIITPEEQKILGKLHEKSRKPVSRDLLKRRKKYFLI